MRVRINNNRKADLSFSLQRNVSWQRVIVATKKVCCLRLQGSRYLLLEFFGPVCGCSNSSKSSLIINQQDVMSQVIQVINNSEERGGG